ncbi:Secreted RxLR effector peptide protein [Phytophthora palmivora]|uniref:Secreted RxLR effector peptide protein n=1 Tax=Phytophthora palmivora TaxID=4796 RepID=A0A2P4XLK7_9STRA|nr:Secreted RxLR effector peptide protein [Phytophthora palmivora]
MVLVLVDTPLGKAGIENPIEALKRIIEDGEERAIGVGTISELATKLKGSASKLAQKFVNIKQYEKQIASKLIVGPVEGILTSSNLKQLTDEVQQLNSKNIVKKVSVIGTLTARYGDEALTKALVAAEEKAKDPAMLLTIHKDGYRIFKNGKLDILDDYVKLVNGKNSDQTPLLRALLTGFRGDDKLGAALLTAKMSPDTMKRAEQLENSLVNKWTSEGQSPVNVFQWLKLYRDDAFTTDNLNKFWKYVDNFNNKNPINKKSTIDIYSNSFGDTAVANRLVSAMKNPATRDVVEKVQSQQLEIWRNAKKSVDDVFSILKLSRTEDAVTTSWKLNMLDEFIKLEGGEHNLIKALTLEFGGRKNLATILERASTTAETTTLQKKQFAALAVNGINPDNFMATILRTDRSLAKDEQNVIADKFKAFYLTLTSG